MNLAAASRRDFALRCMALSSGLGLTASARAAGGEAEANEDGVSHASEAIHQEILFKASRQRVYRALTDTAQFDRITRLSDGMRLLSAPGAAPTQISPGAGGSFTLFGGYITGVQVELVSGERIVQAWRAGGWNAGEYSIARFALSDEGAATRLVFDHQGFPQGQAAHLARGWYTHYWEPIEKFLALETPRVAVGQQRPFRSGEKS